MSSSVFERWELIDVTKVWGYKSKLFMSLLKSMFWFLGISTSTGRWLVDWKAKAEFCFLIGDKLGFTFEGWVDDLLSKACNRECSMVDGWFKPKAKVKIDLLEIESDLECLDWLMILVVWGLTFEGLDWLLISKEVYRLGSKLILKANKSKG